MIGTQIAGWTVREVLVDGGDVRRYGVVAPDGRTGTLEIAAAGTAHAAPFVDRVRALAPHEVLDRGVDSFGNPYVVLPIAYAPYPPPAPAPMFAHERPPLQPPVVARIAAAPSHDARRRRRIWIGVGGAAAALVALNVAIRVGKKSSAADLTVSTSGRWTATCGGSYRVNITASSSANIDLLGRHETTDGMGGLVVELGEREIAGRTSIPLHATSLDGADLDTTVTIEPAGGNGALTDGTYSDRGFNGTRAELRDGSGAHSMSLRFRDASQPADHIALTWTACGIAPATMQKPGATAKLEGKTLHVEIDPGDLSSRLGLSDIPIDASVALVDAAGRPIELAIHSAKRAAADSIVPRLVDIAKHPIAGAPLPADVPAPRPIAMIWGTRLEAKYLEGKTPADAPYVAIVEHGSIDVGSCGPYATGYRRVSATRYRNTIKTKLYEARTGKLVAQKTFTGSAPTCPHSVTVYGTSSSTTIGGDLPTDAFAAWLATFQR